MFLQFAFVELIVLDLFFENPVDRPTPLTNAARSYLIQIVNIENFHCLVNAASSQKASARTELNAGDIIIHPFNLFPYENNRTGSKAI